VWFEQHGYPSGSLGDLMRLALEIKSNGLRHLVDPLRDPPRDRPRDPGNQWPDSRRTGC